MKEHEADVCIVGAGFAGLAAAYQLKKAGKTVWILEARNRVGGRVYSEVLSDGTALNWGGTFIGAGHDRLYALIKELGCATYPAHTQGENIVFVEGRMTKYSGVIPRVNPLTLADLGLAIEMLNGMAKQIPLEAPWNANNSLDLDSYTLGAWIDSSWHPLTGSARKMLKSIMTEIFMSHPNEVSLLHALFMIHSLKNIEWIISGKGGAQQDLLVGGMQSLAERLLQKIGNAICFHAPVRRILQNAHAVLIKADGVTVKAQRVIMAIPPMIASGIEYSPPMPALKRQLMDRSPAGQAIRCYAVYSEPFWRQDGLTGISAHMDGGIPHATIDVTPREGRPGVLTAYVWGPHARELAIAAAAERRKVFLDGLVRAFGAKAAQPEHYAEMDWCNEEWTRGVMFAHYAPGVLTGFGKVLRKPAGRLHWAGTETAIHWSGSMEGAVRSGERAAEEVARAMQ